MSISTNEVNNGAHEARELFLLPDVDSLSSRVRSIVTELLLSGRNKASKLTGSTVTVQDSLITNGNQRDKVPFAPSFNRANLLGNTWVTGITARLIDVDTQNHLDSMSLTSTADKLKGAAVG
ncbi:hypothetical protein RRF57_000384 [Xylaria bambusicola]|uniref:Uncharacterized protein n=1 Tax=Xylaria bambusicola TaxID=326684 RepID=A0AAN7Z2G8_9PEZI